MSPETLHYWLSTEVQDTESIVDVSRPEQAAYLLPYRGEEDNRNKQQAFITINPAIGTAEEINQILCGLEHDLQEDLGGIEMETERTYTPLMFADKSGVLELLFDPETEEKISKMLLGEIPGKIPSSPAIKVKTGKTVLRNPIFAEISAALIGKQLDNMGKHGEAWLDNLITESEAVCIQTGEYTLIDAVTEERQTENVDQCIKDKAVVLSSQPPITEQDTAEYDVIEDETAPKQTSRARTMGKRLVTAAASIHL